MTVRVALGGIRNASKIHPRLWRGEQPPADDETAAALKGAGIQTIVSLRTDGEPAGTVGGRACAPYCVADERGLSEGRGFRFHHVTLTDFLAPHPAEVANALRLLDEKIDDGRTVYVHCRAGVGRTGMITSAWLISRGTSGDDAADIFFHFSRDIYQRTAQAAIAAGEKPYTREGYFDRVRLADQWWAITQFAEALGSPITREFDVPVLTCPEGCEGWADLYREALAGWHR